MKKINIIRLLFPIAVFFALPAKTIAGVVGFDPPTAYRMAVAADCTYHIVPAKWSLGSAYKCIKQHTEIPDFSTLTEKDVVYWPKANGINSYILIKTPKELILALRGTQPPIPDSHTDVCMVQDWLNNFDAVPPEEGFHPGFLKAWNDILQNLKDNPEAKRLLNEKGQRKFLITGHSKGGAIAVIAAIKMLEGGTDWSLPKADAIYAFEAARPVTIKKAESYAGQLPYLIRLDYKADIVPLVPLGAGIKAELANYAFLEKLTSSIFPGGDRFGYGSTGLGKLYYVNSQNKLIDDPEPAILKQQIKTAGLAYADLKGTLGWPLIKGEIPLCHTVENNHLAYVDYLRQYSTTGEPPSNQPIKSNYWDKYCDAGSVIEMGIGDITSRIAKPWREGYLNSSCAKFLGLF